jgi:light-regulated signal transduction histidine kinase (bacteriophytochrome)
MGQLIEDLLNLSEITRSELASERVDLSHLAQGVADRLLLEDPQRRVVFDITSGLVTQGDADLLRIALESLLGNAFKFTSQRDTARIQFGVVKHSGEETFFVRDNGVGFNMAYAGKLFTPFQRLVGINEFSGTGMGLVIAQRIIARHKGRIWPEAAVGEGATFYFTLGK